MELDHEFEVPTGLDEAWTLLLDVPRMATCLPGAELTEVIDDRNFKGTARVKLGPVALAFAGTAEIVSVDEANKKATVRARAADRKGRGNADAEIRFALSPTSASRTAVNVATDLNLTGAVAQYGRASGLVDAVAKEIISEFVINLGKELQSSQTEQARPQAPENTPPVSPNAISGINLLLRALLRWMWEWFAPARK